MSDAKVNSPAAAAAGDWDAIVRHYENCLARYGATPRGVDWPNGADLATRFGVLLEILADAGENPVLLDLGCGPGLLLDYLSATGRLDRVRYRGIDLSRPMIDAARARWPAQSFSCRNITESPLTAESVDVVIINGVMTERVSVTVDAMIAQVESLIAAAFRAARIGIAFNVMNAHLDRQRDDLFHWPFDAAAAFLRREVSPHYAFRADYGLYEYACLVRRHPGKPRAPATAGWWST